MLFWSPEEKEKGDFWDWEFLLHKMKILWDKAEPEYLLGHQLIFNIFKS